MNLRPTDTELFFDPGFNPDTSFETEWSRKLRGNKVQSLRKANAKFWRFHRLKAGITQGEAAAALGYTSAQFISNIERGLCDVPKNQLAIYAKLLSLKPSYVKDFMIRDFARRLEQIW